MNHATPPSLMRTNADSGSAPTCTVQCDDLPELFATAARLDTLTGGNGRYEPDADGLSPILNALAAPLNRPALEEVKRQLGQLGEDVWRKYTGPLRSLQARIDRAETLLPGAAPVDNSMALAVLWAIRDNSPSDGDLTLEETQAIARFKRPGGYEDVQAMLREKRAYNEETFQQARTMITGLRKRPRHRGMAFRGAACLPGGCTEPVVGHIYVEPGFISASSHTDGAFSGPFKMCIDTKSAFHDIADIVDGDNLTSENRAALESEVLAPMGTAFRYLGQQEGQHMLEVVATLEQ